MIEIPLSSDVAQQFSSVFNGKASDFRISWNSRWQTWSMDIKQDNVDILTGVPLVSGVDILAPYTLETKNMFIVNLENVNEDPDLENLGVSARLFILTDEEVSID